MANGARTVLRALARGCECGAYGRAVMSLGGVLGEAARPMETVSVVIPAYNAANTIAETLRSVLEQTWTALEVVVVDDGSRDATAEVAERAAGGDPRVRVLRQANGGVAAARNAGVAAATGAFIAPVDADDVWRPEKLEAQMAEMRRMGPRCGFVYTLSRLIDDESRIVGDAGFPGYRGSVGLRAMALNFVGNGSALLLRRAAFEDAGGYETALRDRGLQGSEDYLLQMLIARRWLVGAVDLALTGYRVTPGGMSMNHDRMKRSRLAALEMALARRPGAPEAAAAAARGVCRGLLAVVRLREGRVSTAVVEASRGMALAPVTTLETIALREGPRLAAVAARRLFRSASPLGPHFREADPSAPIGRRPSPPGAWALPRLARMEPDLEDPAFLARACA